MARARDAAKNGLRATRVDALAVVVQTALLLPVALLRFLDGDEGVYAYASRLALHGQLPYRDFFYEQMPLMPYVYGAWIGLVGETWYGLRIFNVLIAVAVGVLLHRHVRERLGASPALVALVLYAGSGLVLAYFTIVKTFALATLCLFGAYVLVARTAPSGRRFLAAGVLLGLALDTRLLFAAALPAFAVTAVRARRVRALALGSVAAVLPSFVLFVLQPRAFLFDNIGYHASKSSGGLVGDLHEKGQTAATLLGLEPTDREVGLQFLLLVAACAATVAVPRLRTRARLALATAVSLGVASFFPTPTYVQYFCVLVPFLAVAAVEALALVRPRAATLVLAGSLAVYVGAAAVAVHRFTRHEPVLRPSIASVQAVAELVDAETSPGERVLSSWPGYLFGTHGEALPDYTNQFAPVAAANTSQVTARRVRVVSERELERRIRNREVRLVVYRNWVTSPPFARWDAALAFGRYRLIAELQTARVYRR